MAKEMMIVFVYDTCYLRSEEQDPARAVLFFHPGWVSDAQRHALCGQVVGTAHCVGALLAPPTLISLQSGKFMLRHYGRYLLAIGSDRNIPDWVLEGRTKLLSDLIGVYHGDLETVSRLYPDERFPEKLYHILETYIPVLQFGCHIFQRVPMLSLPKSATATYMEAMQVLEHCRRLPGTLGGFILYNNKVVGSQLPPGLTSLLAVTEPHRVKSPAERAPCSLAPPPATHLLIVHLTQRVYRKLCDKVTIDHAEKYIKNQDGERDKGRDMPGGLKRDKSLLFTAVPEEDQTLLSPPQPPAFPDVVPYSRRQRPNKLSLGFKAQASLDEAREDDVDKVFTGQTSVCSTPMVEYKRLHGNVLSICQNPESQAPDARDPAPPDILSDTAPKREKDELITELNSVGQHYVPKPAPTRKLGSMDDLHEAIKRISSRAAARLRPKTRCDSPDSPQKSKTLTINDPSFPVFRNDGVDISESLYRDYLEKYHAELDPTAQEADNMFAFNKKCEIELENFDTERAPSPKKPIEVKADHSRRKSLSLPLKSLSEGEGGAGAGRRGAGVQLTPLMEKLTHLAFSDKSSGYGSRVATPLEMREFTPITERPPASRHRQQPADSDTEGSSEEGEAEGSVRCALFVHSLNSTALLMLLELDACEDGRLLTQLWETSINTLGNIEQQCVEPLPTGARASDYSYLVLDPDWGTVHKGGPWSAADIATMGLAHAEIGRDRKLTQLILRSDQSCVLGTQCGGSEVYYAESGARKPGPPAPSDPLATAPLKAKRRLHRDHSIVIL